MDRFTELTADYGFDTVFLSNSGAEAVENVRGKGSMVAIDLPSKEFLDRMIRATLERGPLTLSCGRRSMRLVPPLDVTEREILLGAELLVEAIEDTSSKRDTPTDPTTVT